MFDPFFNENDQLEIVLGCSLKNFTKFIGHPVMLTLDFIGVRYEEVKDEIDESTYTV